LQSESIRSFHLYAISDEKVQAGDYYIKSDRVLQWNQELQDLVDNHKQMFNEESQNIPNKIVITTDESFLYGELTKYLMFGECLLSTFYNCDDWTQCFLHHKEMNWWFRRRSVLRIKRASQ